MERGRQDLLVARAPSCVLLGAGVGEGRVRDARAYGSEVGVIVYVARRLAGGVAVMFVVVTCTFVLARVVPSDPARAAAGQYAGPAQVKEVARSLGLDKPLWRQYVEYMDGLIHGSLGISYQSRQPIAPVLTGYLAATLELVFWSFVIYTILSVAFGIVWALRDGKHDAWIFRLLAMVGASLPVFWVALVLQLWVAGRWNLLPIDGRLGNFNNPPTHITGFYTIDALLTGNFGAFSDAWAHLALPVASLVLSMFAVAARLTQKSLHNEFERPYVRTAISKGAGATRLIFNHCLRNALNPVVTLLGLQFGWLLGGTVLVEVVFAWPGIGNYLYTSLENSDFPAIMAVTLVITAGFVIANLIVDFIYPLLDPRIRTR
jgi:peptide/nickel transport system permease protein